MILVVLAGRILWPKLREAWEEAKRGGAILASPGEYAARVVLPSLGAWLAKAGVIAAFLASYGITVSFHTVMAVMGGQQFSIAAWNIVFAVVVVIWAFGWAGGKALVERSYADARAQAKRRAEPA